MRLVQYGIPINLLSNAIKFSQRNSVVAISANREGGYILVKIANDGVGLSKAKRKKLLEKHTTITRRSTENKKGTGLGLLISKSS